MTDKERLKEIKEEYEWHAENEILPRTSDDNFEWLIQQAERVQELEQKLKYAETDLALAERLLKNEKRHKLTYRKVAQRYQDEKNRYREALEFYSNPQNYFPQDDDVCSLITMDYGGKARRELGESE